MASAVLVASALAESSTKEECITLCKEAAKFLDEKGFYPAVAEINNKEGKFVTKNMYVFLMDLDGHLLAHPFNAQHIGRDGTGSKDTNGKLYVQDRLPAKGRNNVSTPRIETNTKSALSLQTRTPVRARGTSAFRRKPMGISRRPYFHDFPTFLPVTSFWMSAYNPDRVSAINQFPSHARHQSAVT
jgi:hypothetical protein